MCTIKIFNHYLCTKKWWWGLFNPFATGNIMFCSQIFEAAKSITMCIHMSSKSSWNSKAVVLEFQEHIFPYYWK